MEKNFLLYGMQRTGSNYVEELVKKNFTDVSFLRNEYSRALPTHKHFRLYEEKHLIPQNKYMNSFKYDSHAQFDDHVSEIVNKKNINYLVVVKNPYSWYLSYKRHAKKFKYNYYKNSVCPHFILEYNAFYSKWLEFSEEVRDRIMIVRYEDVIHDFEHCMDRIKQSFGLNAANSEYLNIKRAPMSRHFNVKRLIYYKTNAYMDMIGSKELNVINNLLDKGVLGKFGYELK